MKWHQSVIEHGFGRGGRMYPYLVIPAPWDWVVQGGGWGLVEWGRGGRARVRQG